MEGARANETNPSRKDPTHEEEDDTLMVCRCETPKVLFDLLQSFSKQSGWSRNSGGRKHSNKSQSMTQSEAILGNKLHPMTVFCTKSGLTIHSQSTNKQFQASMELPATLFGHYRLMKSDVDDDDLSYDFTIHWQTFLQCLTVLMIGTGGDKVHHSSSSYFRKQPPPQSSSLTLSYHTSTEVLRLEWEGGGSTAVATAAIPGLNPPPADEAAELSTAFGQSPIQARWLCPYAKHELSEAKELEYLPGATTVKVRFLQEVLLLSAKGHSGMVVIHIPAPIEFSIDPNERPPSYTYSLEGWKQALQPLDMAKETCLSVNARGILAIQHQLIVDAKVLQDSSNESAFSDFLLLPLEVDEDNDEENAQEASQTEPTQEVVHTESDEESRQEGMIFPSVLDHDRSESLGATQESRRRERERRKRQRKSSSYEKTRNEEDRQGVSENPLEDETDEEDPRDAWGSLDKPPSEEHDYDDDDDEDRYCSSPELVYGPQG